MIQSDSRVFNFHYSYSDSFGLRLILIPIPIPVYPITGGKHALNSTKTVRKCSALRIWTNVFMNLNLTPLRWRYGARWERAVKDWGHSRYKVGIFFIPVGCLILFSKTIILIQILAPVILFPYCFHKTRLWFQPRLLNPIQTPDYSHNVVKHGLLFNY